MCVKRLLYNLATDQYRGLIPAIPKSLLLLCSFVYGLTIRILMVFYRIRPYQPACKVISVGNITLGGTGKTVLVEALAGYLKQSGHKVAILSRGYGRTLSVHNELSLEALGDEPFMLVQNLKDVPVIVDADRIRAVKRARRDYRVDTVILDDGFQQWRMKKDLDIVLIDAASGFGNRHMLPRGILREPLSGLRKADIFILTNTNLISDTRKIQESLARLNPMALILESVHRAQGFYRLENREEVLDIALLKGKSAALLCAIANPASFQNTVTKAGINVACVYAYPDHYAYKLEDLQNIAQDLKKKNISTLLTTEKDAAKIIGLKPLSLGLNILVLRIELKINNHEQEFYNRLLRIYST